MRYLLVALVLIVVFAGATMRAPREVRRPVPRGGYPPAPTASEESGMAETGVAQVVPASPPSHWQVRPPDPAATRSRSPRVSLPSRPAPAPSPLAQIRNDGARPPAGPRRIRDPWAGAEPAPSGERQAGDEPGIQPLSPQAGTIVRAPVVTPPLLQTPVAGYPVEGYRVVVDRSMLTPRLRFEAAQGRVMLKVLVHADGSVGSVEVTESSGILVLDQAAVRQASTWEFAPATRDGQPIEAWALISVRFVVP